MENKKEARRLLSRLFSFFVGGLFRLVVIHKAEGEKGDGREDTEVVADAHVNDIFGDGAGD